MRTVEPVPEPVPTSVPRSVPDKRAAILDAARRLIARSGLHDTPMAAVAREAGVAAGTLYLYFPSKEAMINALYLDLVEARTRVLTDVPPAPPDADPAEAMWRTWSRFARWHLDHSEASNVIHQCEASGILTAESRDAHARLHADALARYDDAVARGLVRPLTRQVLWALYAGPIFVLCQVRDAGEIAITDDVLRATFDGVRRSVMP